MAVEQILASSISDLCTFPGRYLNFSLGFNVCLQSVLLFVDVVLLLVRKLKVDISSGFMTMS